ncbi:hypothetical protein N8940_00260 [Sphingomonadaceae bacterium]|nr:hypothetical protein [Sphingomonadaceae bacterium]
MNKNFLSLLLIPLMAACVSAPNPNTAGTVSTAPPPRPATTVTPTQPRPPSPTGFRAPRVMNVPGLEGVIGQNADALTRQFGAARLDVREGDVRKLQFSADACVLDIYLYPLTQGATPTATYVDARRSSDGLDVDRASCVAALKR